MNGNIYSSINKIDKQFLIWIDRKLENSLIGNVYSVYDKVINFISPNKDHLFTLALEEVVQSPQMMKTSNNNNFFQMKSNIEIGTPILRYGEKAIMIGNMIWDYSNAKVWNGDIVTKELKNNRFTKESLKEISNFLEGNGLDSGLLSAWYEYSYKTEFRKKSMSIFTDLFLDRIKKMHIAIKNNNDDEFINASYRFIGLGIGLTPSGDDFILGCLTVWKYLKSPLYDLFINNNSIEKLKGRSTTVSYFMLKNCMNGFVNEALLKLLKFKDEYSDMDFSLHNLLKIGSTSGTDMLIGVIFAYEHELYKKEEV